MNKPGIRNSATRKSATRKPAVKIGFVALLFIFALLPRNESRQDVKASELKEIVCNTPTVFVTDKAHSKVGFRVRHLGISNVNGFFDEYEAKVSFDTNDFSTLKAEATIQVNSLNTGIDRRDNHLRSDDFFNAEAYPVIKFVSKEIRNIDKGRFELVGDLTIRDITREVVFDAEFFGIEKMGQTTKAGFEASTMVNRFDYDLKWDRMTEAGGLVVSENVRIQLDLELNAQE